MVGIYYRGVRTIKYYAKSFPKETIKEHTQQLLRRLKVLKAVYKHKLPLSERDWYLLEIAVKYHDVGKFDLVFQNKIRVKLNLPLLSPNHTCEIPHNFLSVLAIPFSDIELDEDEIWLVSQVVAYHHEREKDINKIKTKTKEVYKQNILPFKEDIEIELGYAIDGKAEGTKLDDVQQRVFPEDEIYQKYILLKGMLHRLDHAASAHVPIELAAEMNVNEAVNSFFKRIKRDKRELQQFTENNQDKHIVVVAQTGMGKTEAGLLWLGEEKGFFTLPLRVSLNAMYSRVKSAENIHFSKIEENGEEAVGLLHSTSLEYLSQANSDVTDYELEKVHSQSKELANKLVITTIDQILKFPFYYLGFEKEYSIMATSKIIIDELQAYDPEVSAVLLRAMVMIDKIGGSFLIMTATLPNFFYNALQNKMKHANKQIEYKRFYDDNKLRHHLSVEEKSVLDTDVHAEIIANSVEKSVLVICNTVNRAREVFKKLEEQEAEVFLLHSRFMRKDRALLEKGIIEFAENQKKGIWVTTQLVEASLDIDFDMLYTEMATLDSIFQRFGRCNRKGEKSVTDINIKVLLSDVSGIGKKGDKKSVYHPDIYHRSVKLLQEIGIGIMNESTKLCLIDKLYDEASLKGTDYLNRFYDALHELERKPHYEINKGEAQKLLRDIQQIQVIPRSWSNDLEFNCLIKEWEDIDKEYKLKNKNIEEKESLLRKKRKARQKIEEYSINVNEFTAKKIGMNDVIGIKGLYYIACEYSERLGLLTNKIDFTD